VNRAIHRCLLVAGLLAALIDAPAKVRAGEQLTVPELAERTDGVVVVQVQLGKAQAPAVPPIQVLRNLDGTPSLAAPDPAWFGLCLPSRALLAQWSRAKPKWPARRTWRQGLARGKYQAVVFLKTRDGRTYPYCEDEAMFMRHTDLSPGFPAYLREAAEAWRQRPSSRPPAGP
jgi:hypothetical protein